MKRVGVEVDPETDNNMHLKIHKTGMKIMIHRLKIKVGKTGLYLGTKT